MPCLPKNLIEIRKIIFNEHEIIQDKTLVAGPFVIYEIVVTTGTGCKSNAKIYMKMRVRNAPEQCTSSTE
jgi:hypothetical protein